MVGSGSRTRCRTTAPTPYPGFPLPGVMPFLHLSESLFDGSVPVDHQLERVVLVTNPSDLAVRQDAGRLRRPGLRYSGLPRSRLDPELRWTHDFVDPWSPAGDADQVVALLLAGLGVGEGDCGRRAGAAAGHPWLNRRNFFLPPALEGFQPGHDPGRASAGTRCQFVNLPEVRVSRSASQVSRGSRPAVRPANGRRGCRCRSPGAANHPRWPARRRCAAA